MLIKYCILVTFILLSSFMMHAQNVMHAAKEPIKSVALDHEIISSSVMENYNFRDPFKWASPAYGKIFSVDPEKNKLLFVIENTGPTDSHEQELIIIVQNARVRFVTFQEGHLGQKTVINESSQITVPANSLSDAILGLFPFSPSSQIMVNAYTLGIKRWSSHIMIEMTLEDIISQNLIFTVIVKNPNKLENYKNEILDIAFAPFSTLLRFLGESNSTHISFVTQNIKLPEGLKLNIDIDEEEESGHPSVIRDIEGNEYKTIKIGKQIWMAENLRTSKFNDGKYIHVEPDDISWSYLKTPAHYWYGHNELYKETFGTLYNWYAVSTGKLCPDGWHIPTRNDWVILFEYLRSNGYNYSDSKTGNDFALSLATDTDWIYSAGEGTVGNTDYPEKRNLTGFSALPGGWRSLSGRFHHFREQSMWWSSTEYSDKKRVWYMLLDYKSNKANLYYYGDKTQGLYVRCLKNQ